MAFNNLINRFYMATSQTGGGTTGGTTGPTAADVKNQAALNDELKETRSLVFEIKNAFGALSSEAEGLFNTSVKGQKNLDKETRKYYNGIAKEVTKNLKGQRYETEEINKLVDKQKSGSLRLKDVNAALEKSKQRQQSLEDSIKEAIIEGVINEEQILDLRERVNDEALKQEKILKQLTKEAEKQEKALGITYKIFDGIAKIPILNSVINIDKVKAKMEETAGEGKKAWSVFGSGVKESFAQIGKSMTDPLAVVTGLTGLFSFLLKTVLEVDKHLTSFAKNLGMSKDAAHEIEKNFDAASNNVREYSKYLSASTFSAEAQMEATAQLNESLGTATMFTEKMLAGQTLLTKRLGLSSEEAAEFAKFSMLTGKETEKITEEIEDQIVAFNKENKIQLNSKKVMQDVLKVSGQLSANLGNDPKRIAEAVMQAKKLGLTMEQTKKMSESLLDFEGSINNELEAELLTGKSLNLEKARELALSGKTTEAAAELLDQVGGIEEFQNMNVLQQQSLAKTIGLSADEMAEALKQQELLKGTAFQTKEAFLEQYKIAEQQGTLEEFQKNVRQAANGEQLLAMGAQQSAADKFNETIEKLQAIFARLVSEDLLHMVDKFADFVSKGENMKTIIEWIKGAFTAIKIVLGIIVANQIVGMIKGLTSVVGLISKAKWAKIGEAIASAWSAVMSSPESILTAGAAGLAAGAIATAAIMGAVNSNSKEVEDAAISSTGGLMISGPKGSFITDPSDEIVAAPGASKMLGGGGGISKADLDAIANRPVNVSVQANTDTLLRLQTAQTQYGAPTSFA